MFQLINGGYFTRHPKGFCLDRPKGFEHYVLLCIRSESEIFVREQHYHGDSNSILLIPPHTPYRYLNPNGSYIDDWIHFECTADDLKFLPDSIWCHPFSCHNSSVIGTYIEQLLWEKSFAPESFRDQNVDSLFHVIFSHIIFDYSRKKQDSYSLYRFRLQKHRIAMQSAPYLDHQAQKKAEEVGLSLSYYEHLYKDFFGQSFRSDLIKMRIDYAKALITTTNLPLDTIALNCGYNSAVHFHRQFLAKTGVTPGDYRKLHQ